MKVLVTGAGGQVGSILVDRYGALGLTHHELDVTDAGGVRKAIEHARPDVVVNAAAFTDVDACETDPDRAHAVNATGAANVARACAGAGAFLIHLSTDFVFDGSVKDRAYREDDEPNPLNVYGRTKLEGERLAGNEAAIVRTAWVYSTRGRNFLSQALRGEEPLKVFDDAVGSPTWAPDLCNALSELIDKPTPGLFHVAGGGECTRLEFARAAGRNAIREEPSTPPPARRPTRSPLEGRAWVAAGFAPLRTWREALEEALR